MVSSTCALHEWFAMLRERNKPAASKGTKSYRICPSAHLAEKYVPKTGIWLMKLWRPGSERQKLGKGIQLQGWELGLRAQKARIFVLLQYNGSNDYLDWRIDIRYLNFDCIIKYFRSRLIKGCSIQWMHLRLLNLNLWLDLIKTSFFKVLTNFIGSKENSI